MFVPAVNVSDGPVVVDGEGRTLGGGEWGPVDSRTEEVRRAGEAGSLVVHPPIDPGPGQNPRAVEASQAATALGDRHDALQAADKEALLQAAVDAELVAKGAEPHKDDLVALLVRTDVEIPGAASADRADVDEAQAETKAAASRKR